MLFFISCAIAFVGTVVGVIMFLIEFINVLTRIANAMEMRNALLDEDDTPSELEEYALRFIEANRAHSATLDDPKLVTFAAENLRVTYEALEREVRYTYGDGGVRSADDAKQLLVDSQTFFLSESPR